MDECKPLPTTAGAPSPPPFPRAASHLADPPHTLFMPRRTQHSEQQNMMWRRCSFLF